MRTVIAKDRGCHCRPETTAIVRKPAGSASNAQRTFPATTAKVCPDLAEGNSCLRIVGGSEKAPPSCRYNDHAKRVQPLTPMNSRDDEFS